MFDQQDGSSGFDLRAAITRYGPGVALLVRQEFPWHKDRWDDLILDTFIELMDKLRMDVPIVEQLRDAVRRVKRAVRRERTEKRIYQQVIIDDDDGKETNIVDLAVDQSSLQEDETPCSPLMGFTTDLLYEPPLPSKDVPRLSPEQRKLLWAKVQEETYGPAESKRTGMKEGTIRVMLHRLKKKLEPFFLALIPTGTLSRVKTRFKREVSR